MKPQFKVCNSIVLAWFAAFALCAAAGAQDKSKEEMKPAVSAANSAERENWRKSMVKKPRPKNGCFKVEYPKTEWEEVQCGRPSKHFNPRKGKPRTNQVGNGADYAIQSSGSNLISSAEGSFLSSFPYAPTGVEGYVAGTSSSPTPCTPGSGCVANVFMLQMNSQAPFNSTASPFPTPACGGKSGCYGWQQYLFSQTQGPAPGAGQQSVPGASGTTPAVFIEYWLFNWGSSTCPALPSWAGTGNWQSDGAGDCVFNGPTTYVPPQTVADLPSLVMTSTASSTQDTVSISTSTGIYTYTEPTVLNLENSWKQVEFNVFGDCCGTDVTFSSPSLLVAKSSIDDGSTSAPTCVANDGTTGETNNLTFQPTSAPVCCQYGGSSPAIEFMQVYDTDTARTHTAWCGATQLQGDPHIITADGVRYNFQGGGEYVALKDADGTEVQTRQSPISTPAPLVDPSEDDGIATCVSLDTAVAARVGSHRVTYEPNLSGVPDPSGLQLRIDGRLTTLGAEGVNLGDGGRVLKFSDGIEVYFPDGKVLTAVPDSWEPEGKVVWYLNVDVNDFGVVIKNGSTAVGGLMGTIPSGSWLPALPDGKSVGAMPASIPARYKTLYDTFGNAWRVTNGDSLFDYAPGTSTSTFTVAGWPKETAPCTAPNMPPAKPVAKEVAVEACKGVTEKSLNDNCVFDVMATGNTGFAKTYVVTQNVHETRAAAVAKRIIKPELTEAK